MSDVTINISPSNVAAYPAVSSPNQGNVNTEYNVVSLSRSDASKNRVVTGLTLSKSDTDISISSGKFYIDGYLIFFL